MEKKTKEPVKDTKKVPVRTKVKGGQEQGSILSGEQKKKLVKKKLREKKNSNVPRTAQQSIPYQEMFRDGSNGILFIGSCWD